MDNLILKNLNLNNLSESKTPPKKKERTDNYYSAYTRLYEDTCNHFVNEPSRVNIPYHLFTDPLTSLATKVLAVSSALANNQTQYAREIPMLDLMPSYNNYFKLITLRYHELLRQSIIIDSITKKNEIGKKIFNLLIKNSSNKEPKLVTKCRELLERLDKFEHLCNANYTMKFSPFIFNRNRGGLELATTFLKVIDWTDYELEVLDFKNEQLKESFLGHSKINRQKMLQSIKKKIQDFNSHRINLGMPSTFSHYDPISNTMVPNQKSQLLEFLTSLNDGIPLKVEELIEKKR